MINMFSIILNLLVFDSFVFVNAIQRHMAELSFLRLLFTLNFSYIQMKPSKITKQPMQSHSEQSKLNWERERRKLVNCCQWSHARTDQGKRGGNRAVDCNHREIQCENLPGIWSFRKQFAISFVLNRSQTFSYFFHRTFEQRNIQFGWKSFLYPGKCQHYMHMCALYTSTAHHSLAHIRMHIAHTYVRSFDGLKCQKYFGSNDGIFSTEWQIENRFRARWCISIEQFVFYDFRSKTAAKCTLVLMNAIS